MFLRGELEAPPDKSISHRLLLIAPFVRGSYYIHNLLDSLDTRASINLISALGIKCERKENGLLVHSPGLTALKPTAIPIDCGNSGTTARIGMGVLSCFPFSFHLTGDASLSKRPMRRVIEPLSLMGCKFTGAEEHLPIKLEGGHNIGGKFSLTLPSAQVKSALMFAALQAKTETTIEILEDSRDHTERLFQALALPYRRSGKKIYLSPLENSIAATEFSVPGDASSAAFFIVACLMLPGSEIKIKTLNINPTRIGLLKILQEMGLVFELDNERELGKEPVADITIKHQELNTLPAFSKELIPLMIDEFPLLALLCATIPGQHRFNGLRELRVKECDRIAAITLTLRGLGVNIEELEDGWNIEGSDKVFSSGNFSTFSDHRIAMLLKIAELRANGPIKIDEDECISVSFPGFEKTLKTLVRN
ncbi:3-phosphoshikimate 1-carboxyvinyltransferase [Candidatus Riflebacteria bacterium]